MEDGEDSGQEVLDNEEISAKQSGSIDTTELQDQDKLKKVADAAAQLADTKAEIRQSLLEHITELHAQRTALIDRTNLVIDAFETKGGAEEPIKEFRQYIKAVSGLKVDVADVDATSTALKGWLLSKEGGLRWGKNIAIFIVTVLFTGMSARPSRKDSMLTRFQSPSRTGSSFLGSAGKGEHPARQQLFLNNQKNLRQVFPVPS